MIEGLLEALDRRQQGLGRAHMDSLTIAARELLDDNRALLTLQPGETLEDFSLADIDGRMIHLTDLRSAGPVVLDVLPRRLVRSLLRLSCCPATDFR